MIPNDIKYFGLFEAIQNSFDSGEEIQIFF